MHFILLALGGSDLQISCKFNKLLLLHNDLKKNVSSVSSF